MVMIDPERIQRLAAKMGNRKDALEMVHQMRCGGKKYDGGGDKDAAYMYKPKNSEIPAEVIPLGPPYSLAKYRVYDDGTVYIPGLSRVDQDIKNGAYWMYGPIASKKTYLRNKDNGEYFEYDPDINPSLNLSGYDKVGYGEIKPMLPRRDYIGGDNYRLNTVKRVPGLLNMIKKKADSYGLDPNLLLHRFMKEGIVDYWVNRYNTENAVDQNDSFFKNLLNEEVDGFNGLGLDDAGSNLLAGKYTLKDPSATWQERTARNEEGRDVVSVVSPDMNSALEIKAAEMAYRQRELAKRGLTGNAYVNAAYNMGLYHDKLNDPDYVSRNYTVPDYHVFDGGGKFFRTNLQNESPLMYQPMMPINYPIETPLRFRPQPDLGDYQAPESTGMIVNYPISLPEKVPVSVQEPVSAPVVVEVPEQNLFSDEMIARRALKQRYAESAFNDKAKSKAGAQGAWQIMPITLKDYLGRGRGKAGDLNDPAYNRKVRDWVMGIIPRDLQEFWSDTDSDRAKLAKLYAAYNWGAGNLRGFLRKKRDAGIDISNPDSWVDDLNPETRRYVKYLAFDEDIPDSTVYTNAAFEKAAAERGYANGGNLYEMGGPSGPAAPGAILAKYVQDLIGKYKVAAPVAKKAIDMFSGNSNEIVHLGEFMDAFNALPEPMKKRAIEVAMRATHNPTPYNALENYLLSAKNKKANPLDDVKYIITGLGSPSLNINDGLYHEVLTNDKYVLRSPDVKTKNDVIDAVVYGKPLNPNIGTRVTDGDFGILRSYKDRVYPDRNIQFVQTNPPGISTSQEGIESMGVIHPSAKNYFNSTFKTSDPHIDIDNAGYSMEYGNRNDSTFVRAWDIYDFASPADDSVGYKSRWGIDLYDSQGEAVDAIQSMITPLFIRTPWVYYKDASKIVNDDTVQYGIENNINARANGGSIHIKPENRGKFNALLKRTGKSASWFKEHGTPLQRKRATFALNARKWRHGDGGFLDNYFYDGGPYGVIPLGGDYLTYLQTVPEVSGGMIEPSVVTAALPSKFNGSQAAAARYAEGYQKGAKPVSEAMNRAGQDIFNTVDTVVGLTPTPAGAISWLGHMGADAAEGEWGKVGKDVVLAAALGAGARGVGWLRNYIDDATNYGEDLFRAFTDRVPGRVSTNVPPELFNVGHATAPSGAFIAEQAAKDADELARLGRETLLYEPSDTQYYNRLNRVLDKEHRAIERDALRDDYLASDAYALEHPKYEIQNLGGGYMLKSLMRGNPLEKQISKNGTVNVNNVRALVGKGSKVEQAVVDKVLASEEFAGKKAIDYNKFRKAVQDELITYERTPDTRWATYGEDAIGFRAGSPTELREINEARTFNDKRQVIEVYGTYEEKMQLRDMTHLFRDGEMTEAEYDDAFDKLFSDFSHKRTGGAKSETYVFSSSRIPNGSAKHYDPNTLGHSRTYTTADEPDVLHVMESQSDWGQGYKKMNFDGEYNQKRINSLERRINNLKESINSETEGLMTEKMNDGSDMSPWFADSLRKQIEKDKQLLEELTVELDMRRNPKLATQQDYLAENFTSRQIQENLRYAAEKGQTKMRYPTRETAAKIEGYPEVEMYIDERGIKHDTPYEYDQDIKAKLDAVQRRFDEISRSTNESDMPEYERLARELGELSDAYANSAVPIKNAKKVVSYVNEHEGILKKYDAFPKQYKKLYKNADVRTVADPKGNTWYEVDVPENYLKQEWAYEEGGSLVLPKMMMDKHSPDKLRKAIASIKAKRMK